MPGFFILDGYIELAEDGMTAKVIGVLRRKEVPLKVNNLRLVEVDDTFVSLAWDTGGNALRWKLYRDDVLIDTITLPSYLDEDVDPDSDYVYHVIGNNSKGDGEASDDLPVHTEAQLAPDAPLNVRYVDSEEAQSAGHVEIEWDDPGNVVEWKVSRDTVLVATVQVPRVRDTGLTPSTTYDYEIVAVNASGESDPSTVFEAETLANTQPLWSSPGTLGLVENSGFSLDLTTICIDPDGHALSFSIVASSVPGLTLTGATYGGVPTTPGDYSVTFRADDGFTTADREIFFDVADSDVTAPSVPGSVVAVSNSSTVDVTWAASTDASGVARYRVFRDGQLRNDNVQATSYQETGVPNGTYTYSVSAVDLSQNANESAQGSADPVEVSLVTPNPDVPIFTSVIPTTNSVALAWQPGPNGATPTNYILRYSVTSASGPFSEVYSGATPSFNHTGLNPGDPAFYRLFAFNGAAQAPSPATANTTLAVGSSIAFTPGDWWMAPRHGSTATFAHRRDNLYPVIFTGAGGARFKGIKVEYPWAELEGAKGNVDKGVAAIRADLEILAAFTPPRKLVVQFNAEKRNVSLANYTKVFPPYMGPGTGNLNAVYSWVSTAPGNPQKLSWDMTIGSANTAFLEMWTALAAKLKALPNNLYSLIEGFRMNNETTASFDLNRVTKAEHDAHCLEFGTHLRNLFPDKAVFFVLNGQNQDFHTLRDQMIAIDVLLGGGDTLPRAASGNGVTVATRGTKCDRDLMGVTSGFPDIRVAPRNSVIWMGIEGSELGGGPYPTQTGEDFYTAEEISNFLNDVIRSPYAFWQTWEGPDPEQNIGAIKAWVADNPMVNLGVPGHYP